MPPSREIFRIGNFALRWYSVMIVLGALVASWLATKEAKRRGQDPENVWQMLPLVLIAGILGARIGWVLVSLGDIQAQGWEHAFYIWEGGLSIQGAIVGGILALIYYTRAHNLDFFEWTDIIVPGLALAQAIGRWGNFFNQEAFGSPCDYPWCIPISQDVLRSHAEYQQYVGYTRFHPTFAYEMLWDLLNFGVLMWLGRQKRFELRTGDLLWAYGIIYSIGRFFIEEIRVDSAMAGGLKVPTIFAVITIFVCWVGFIVRHRPGSEAPMAVTSLPEGALSEDEWQEGDDQIANILTGAAVNKRGATTSARAASANVVIDTAATEDYTDEDNEDYDEDADDEDYADEEETDEEPTDGKISQPLAGDTVTIAPTASNKQPSKR